MRNFIEHITLDKANGAKTELPNVTYVKDYGCVITPDTEEYAVNGESLGGIALDVDNKPYADKWEDMGDATLVSLVKTAYGVTSDKVKKSTILNDDFTASKGYIFANKAGITEVYGIGDLIKNTKALGNTSSGLFWKTYNLETIDTTDWDTSECTSFSRLFGGGASNPNNKLKKVYGIENWDTSNVTDMNRLFSNCDYLEDIDLSGWDVSQVTNMDLIFNSWGTFTGDTQIAPLTTLGDLSNWDVSKVTSMNFMFNNRTGLRYIGDLSNWDVSKVTNMHDMFGFCRVLSSIGDLSNWNVSKVTSMNYMFHNCKSLASIGDLSNWVTNACTDMGSMFNGCEVLSSIGDLSNWNVNNVTDMSGVFKTCKVLSSIGDLSNWNVSKATNMDSMFYNCGKLNSIGNISNWNVSKVTNMMGMFAFDYQLNSIGDLSNWDVSKVTNMNTMFYKCQALSSLGNLSNWNVSKVTNMMGMFYKCQALSSLGNLSNWNVSKVTNMMGMFYETKIQTIGDLSNWNTSACTDMGFMFDNCYNLTTVGDISNWDVSKVKRFSCMFEDTKLSELDISGWQCTSVESDIDTENADRGLYKLDIFSKSETRMPTLTTFRFGQGFLNNNVPVLDFSTLSAWSHDSAYESMYTNQVGRDTTKTKTIKVHANLYSTFTTEEIANIASVGITVTQG